MRIFIGTILTTLGAFWGTTHTFHLREIVTKTNAFIQHGDNVASLGGIIALILPYLLSLVFIIWGLGLMIKKKEPSDFSIT